MAIALTAAIGRYPHTAPLLDGARRSALLDLRFEAVKPISRAFAPMVRQGRFDVSEMAIATFLMAKAAGKPLVLLPVTLAARFQEAAALCRADGPVRGPADLAGRRVGVRAYSQTTGMWLRGVLAERHGVAPDAVPWITFEDAHLAEYKDPPWAERAPAGADLTAMLKGGEIDAAIFGNELPDEPGFRPVFADATAAGEAFRAAYGFVPVNHLAVLRRDVVEAHPEAAAELVRLLSSPGLASGRAALAAPISLASRWCAEQGLTPRVLTLDEVWEGLPAGVG
jgi:4,5-dihydroxyphthalate decarboxylase